MSVRMGTLAYSFLEFGDLIDRYLVSTYLDLSPTFSMSDKGGVGQESEDFTEVSGSGKGIWGTFNSCARGISQTKKI